MAKNKSLSSLADKAKLEFNKLYQKLRFPLYSSHDSLSESSERIAQTTLEIVEKADSYVRKKPWYGVSIGTAIGVFIGILIARR